MDISVVIVSYNVKYFTEQCIRSVFSAKKSFEIEIIVIDNNSADDSIPYLKEKFPDLIYIENKENLGFGRACNQGFRIASGKYYLVLNPDTILSTDTLQVLHDFLENNPKAGMVGPLILLRNGTIEPGVMRSFPTPWASFCKLSGLSKLFPKSKLFSKYKLSYLDPNKSHQIEVLAGSCILVKSEVVNSVGGFDEDFFLYGEDVDWCYRIHKNGWQNWYTPDTRIVHFKGESSKRSLLDKDREFYRAMHQFVRKYFTNSYSFLYLWIIEIGIFAAYIATRLARTAPYLIWSVIDFIGIWCVLWLGRYIRWNVFKIGWLESSVMSIQAFIWVLSLLALGIYTKKRNQLSFLTLGMFIGFFINSTITYFIPQIAFSRFLNLWGLFAGAFWVIGWRELMKNLFKMNSWINYNRRRSLIVGTGAVGTQVNQWLKDNNANYEAIGFVDVSNDKVGSIINGVAVLGNIDDLPRLVHAERVEEILFALDTVDYNAILNVISQVAKSLPVTFKIVTPESAFEAEKLGTIFSVEHLNQRSVGSSIKKLLTTVKGN